jgi:Sel1 repeat
MKIFDVIGKIYTVGKEVYDRYKQIEKNNQECRELMDRMNVAKDRAKTVYDLAAALDEKSFPKSLEGIAKDIDDTFTCVTKCQEFIDSHIQEIINPSVVRDTVYSKAKAEKIKALTKSLNEQLERFDQSLTVIIFNVNLVINATVAKLAECDSLLDQSIRTNFKEVNRILNDIKIKMDEKDSKLLFPLTELEKTALHLHQEAVDFQRQNRQEEMKKKFLEVQKAYEQAIQKEQSARSMVNLGVLLMEGKYIPEDQKAAFRHLENSAKKGFPRGIYTLGQAYDKGWGTPVNQLQAVKFYLEAAKKGSNDAKIELQKPAYYSSLTVAEAQYELGNAYEEGVIIPQDMTKATALYEKAMKQGDALAEERYLALTSPTGPPAVSTQNFMK